MTKDDKTYFKDLFTDFKKEIKTSMVDLRSEMKEMGNDLRSEMKEMGNDLRSEMKEMRTELKDEICHNGVLIEQNASAIQTLSEGHSVLCSDIKVIKNDVTDIKEELIILPMIKAMVQDHDKKLALM